MTCGVYKITCRRNRKTYIGCSSNIEHRFSGHLWRLRRGKHNVRSLQADFHKYGEASFKLEILDVCTTPREAFFREAYWIHRLQPDYNWGNMQLGRKNANENSPQALNAFHAALLALRRALI